MGIINVFSGPMKSGKSSTLIREAKKLKNEGKSIKIFKPIIDNRFSDNNIMDRKGNKFPSINIEKIEDIEKYDAEVYFIDEFQFLNGEVDVIQKLASKGKKFYIAGLNLTTEKKPFGKMGDLFCVSDNVKMMSARCDYCGARNAIYTYCTVEKKEDILVGEDMYKAVCSDCYTKLTINKGN